MAKSFLERQRERRNSRLAIIAKFERTRVRLPRALFLVFEALLDKAAYLSEVKKEIPAPQYVSLLCEGKPGVLEFLKYVREKYPDAANVLFFIDRDYDDFVGIELPQDPRVYVTDGYSIESHFCSADALRVVLDDILNVEDDDGAVVDGYVERYQSLVQQFSKDMSPLTALVISVRRLKCTANIGNVNMNNIFFFDTDGKLYRRNDAFEQFINETKPTVSLLSRFSLRIVVRELRRQPASTSVRGKFACWLFIKFLSFVKADLQKKKVPGERESFINAHVDTQNLVQLLSGRLAVPNSLTAFLKAASERYQASYA